MSRRGGYSGECSRAAEVVRVTGVVFEVRRLADLIDEEMAERNLSWAALARRVGVTRQYLAKALEKGSLPKEHFDALAALFGWDERDFRPEG